MQNGDPVLHVQGGGDDDLAPHHHLPSGPPPTVVFSVILTPALLCLVNTLCTTQLQCLLLPPALPVGHLLRGRAAAANFFHHLPEGGHLHWGGWGWWSHRG